MSKRTKKAAPTSQPAARRSSAVRQATAARQAASRPALARSRAQATKNTPRLNLRTLRIAAAALGILSLAGFVSLLVFRGAPYTAWVVIELIMLALVAGICIFTTIRPDITARLFFQQRK